MASLKFDTRQEYLILIAFPSLMVAQTRANFHFSVPDIVIYLLNKDRQLALLFLNLFEYSILHMFRTE
jgi:hypothetical protein